MIEIDPIIAVRDVEASSKWYQSLFECKSLHGGKEFDVLVAENGTILLCLHKWGEHGHPTMTDRDIPGGNGLILYFRTDIMETIRKNAEKMGAEVEEEIHFNSNSLRAEFSLRDPDGYFLIVTEFHHYEG